MNDKIINPTSFLILIQIKNNGRSFYSVIKSVIEGAQSERSNLLFIKFIY